MKLRALTGSLIRLLIVGAGFSSVSCEQTIISVQPTTDGASDSLRAAIKRANDDASITRIELLAGSYHLTLCDRDDANASGDLDLNRSTPLTIAGAHGTAIIDSDCGLERVMDSHGTGLLRLVDLDVVGGSQSEAEGQPGFGGGLRAQGDVILERANFMNNHLWGGHGSSGGNGDVPPGAAYGAGLYVGGSLIALDSMIYGNRSIAGEATRDENGAFTSDGAHGFGGGAFVAGTVTIEGGYIRENYAFGSSGLRGGDARGGGISQTAGASGAVQLAGTVIDSNYAIAGDSMSCQPAGAASGGGIASFGPATLRDVTSGNQARGGNVTGCSQSATATGGSARGGFIASSAKVFVIGGAHEYNIARSGQGADGAPPAPAMGGAVHTSSALQVTGGGYRHNAAISAGAPQNAALARGGALATDAALSVSGSEFSLNLAQVAPTSEGRSGSGLGMALYAARATVDDTRLRDNPGDAHPTVLGPAVAIAGHLEISDSLLGGNRSGISAGALSATAVSFIANQGPVIASAGSVALRNTTLGGNLAGITAGALTLEHVTMVNNAGPAFSASALSVFGSVVMTSDAPVCAAMPASRSATFSWFSDASCRLGAGNREAMGEPGLMPLVSPDAALLVHIPALGSDLVDAIPASACRVAEDARGSSRPRSGACDLGAVEVGRPPGTGPADLALAFTRGPTEAVVNEASSWELEVSNRGPYASTPIVVVNVPSNARISSLAAPGTPCWAEPTAAHPARWLCGIDSPIPAGASAKVTLVGNVLDGSASVTWNAHVTGDLTAPRADDVAAITTATTQTPRFDLELTAARDSALQVPGQATRFEIRAKNNGSKIADNVQVQLLTGTATDTFSFTPLAGSVTIAPGDWQWPGRATWAISKLAPGEIAKLEGSALTDCAEWPVSSHGLPLVASRHMEAKVSSNGVDTYPGNDSLRLNTCTAELGTSDLSVTSLAVLAGPTQTDRIVRVTVHNTGPSAAVTAGPWAAPPQVRLRLPAGANSTNCISRVPWADCILFVWAWNSPSPSVPVGADTTLDFFVQVDPGQLPAAPWISAEVYSHFTPDPVTANDARSSLLF